MASETQAATAAEDSDLARFGRDLKQFNLTPLWERTTPQRPGGPCVPALWRYAELRPHLVTAARLITKRAAERRVLVLENPSLPGAGYATTTLYAGLQIILPGEIAPTHRHSQNALRLFVEGDGAYTAIDGERVTMRPGDFVVTPSWSWHDHGNLGTAPAVWLDGLDTPFAQFFGAIFREDHPEESQTLARPEGDAAARYGAGLLPIDGAGALPASPVLIYPYERTRAALTQLGRGDALHPAHGAKLRYANPTNGRHPFSTMAAFMQFLPAGFDGTRYRSTEGSVFIVVEGAGSVAIGDRHFAFAPHDVFVVPPWQDYCLSGASESVLFSYSDRAAQEALGFFREKLG